MTLAELRERWKSRRDGWWRLDVVADGAELGSHRVSDLKRVSGREAPPLGMERRATGMVSPLRRCNPLPPRAMEMPCARIVPVDESR